MSLANLILLFFKDFMYIYGQGRFKGSIIRNLFLLLTNYLLSITYTLSGDDMKIVVHAWYLLVHAGYILFHAGYIVFHTDYMLPSHLFTTSYFHFFVTLKKINHDN